LHALFKNYLATPSTKRSKDTKINVFCISQLAHPVSTHEPTTSKEI